MQITNLFCQLRHHGYTNIDAIDGSRDMLRLAEEKQLYRHYYVSLLGGQHAAPFDDGTVFLSVVFMCTSVFTRNYCASLDTYDVVISCGSFGPGHLYPDVLTDLIRIVRKGNFSLNLGHSRFI